MDDSYDTGVMGEVTPAQKLEQSRAIINSLRRLKDIQGQKLGSADWWKSQVSLDTPKDQDAVDVGNDIAIGFTPGLGTLQAGRDFERSRREGSALGMGLSALGLIPFAGGVTKLAKGAIGVGAKVKALREGVDAMSKTPNRVRIPHEIDPEKLRDVISEMKKLGRPKIDVVDTGEEYLALEGSHRLTAAHKLGMKPIYNVVDQESIIDPKAYDVDTYNFKWDDNKPHTAGEMAWEMHGDGRSPQLDFIKRTKSEKKER